MKYTIKTSKGTFGINTDYKGIKLSEITEEQASEILGVEDYGIYSLIPMDWYTSKLKDLLESQGIEITENTYIFKV